MFDFNTRCGLTINEIETSEKIENNWELFNKGIDILKQRILEENSTEFTDEEREILEEIYTIIEEAPEIFNEMEYSQSRNYTILNFGIYNGYPYYILSIGYHPCSYIELGKDDILYGASCEELDHITGIDCHGGFTYASDKLQSPNYSYVNPKENKWVIGWDYGHYLDWAGYLPDETNKLLGNKKWTTKELKEEMLGVIDQIVEYKLKMDDSNEQI